MPSNRRIGLEGSVRREVLMDAVEQVMVRHGYGALTARRVAETAGLKHQLVYYYFLTMDELLIAAYRRRTGRMLARIETATGAADPLRALWTVHSEPAHAALTVEYLALANHNDAIKRETVEFGERIRQVGLDRLIGDETAVEISPFSIALAISSLGAILGMEMGLGITGGHDELRTTIEWCFERLKRQQD